MQKLQANLNNTKHSNYLVLGDRICTTETFLESFLHPSNIEIHLTLSQQGGSVMCVRTLCSDPAHLLFSRNCLTNKEEIKKKLTYQHIVQQTTKRIKKSTLESL